MNVGSIGVCIVIASVMEMLTSKLVPVYSITNIIYIIRQIVRR